MDRIEKAELLEAEARDLRAEHKRELVAKSYIKHDAVIFDLDCQKYAVVTALKNGSNDFEANFLHDSALGRGYHYLVRNWREATQVESYLYETGKLVQP